MHTGYQQRGTVVHPALGSGRSITKEKLTLLFLEML